MRLLTASPEIPTLGDLLERLGGISADRVRYYPLPGTATEEDVIAIEAREDRLCELVDGVLVEKSMGFQESYIAGIILSALQAFIRPRKMGFVTGEAGTFGILPGLVRIPDVAFISCERLPGGRVPHEAIPKVVPDLAVEVLSKSNTQAEMSRKLREYFKAGVRLVWMVDPPTRTIRVYSSPRQSVTLTVEQELNGGEVLPGFVLPVREMFAELEAN